LTRIDVKAFNQCLRFRVGVGVKRLPRMAVAAEKTLEPEHIAVSRAADDHRSASSRLEQPDATQYQGAHDPLAQLRLSN
jgi:hypothetical protein